MNSMLNSLLSIHTCCFEGSFLKERERIITRVELLFNLNEDVTVYSGRTSFLSVLKVGAGITYIMRKLTIVSF